MKKMKNKIITSICLFVFALCANAQVAITVTEDSDNIDKQSGTVLRTKINRTEEKTIVKEWKGKMKDYDGDVDTKKNRITAENVKIEAIGTVGLTVLGEVRKSSENEQEFVVMFLKNGQSISSKSDLSAFTAMKNIVRNFATELSKESTADYQKNQLKVFTALQEDLEDTKKEEEEAKEDIEDAKKKIEEAKEEIEKANEEIKEAEEKIKDKTKFLEKNAKNQAETTEKIAKQQNVVNGANSEMEYFK